MNIYIASSHKLSEKITQKLVFELDLLYFDVFFPESLGVKAENMSQMFEDDKICCEHINKSDIMIAICPFGYSVSVEIGRFLMLKEIFHKESKLIILDCSGKESIETKKVLSEAMIMPHVDLYVHSIEDLMKNLKLYEKEIK